MPKGLVKIINLTPHNVIDTLTDAMYESQGNARVSVVYREAGALKVENQEKRIQIFKPEYGEVTGLPQWREGVFYIVSRMVYDAVRSANKIRTDLLVPGEPVRDDAGRVIGCKGFVC